MPQHPLARFVRDVPDFPKPGILFRDITPLLREQFSATVDALAALLSEQEWQDIEAIAGIESRGFILASALAYARGKGLVLIRKPGKLPPPVHSLNYHLEYGSDGLQLSSTLPAQRLLLIDDVLATGGTLRAACALCTQGGHTLTHIMTLIDLAALNDFAWHGLRARSLLRYED